MTLPNYRSKYNNGVGNHKTSSKPTPSPATLQNSLHSPYCISYKSLCLAAPIYFVKPKTIQKSLHSGLSKSKTSSISCARILFINFGKARKILYRSCTHPGSHRLIYNLLLPSEKTDLDSKFWDFLKSL